MCHGLPWQRGGAADAHRVHRPRTTFSLLGWVACSQRLTVPLNKRAWKGHVWISCDTVMSQGLWLVQFCPPEVKSLKRPSPTHDEAESCLLPPCTPAPWFDLNTPTVAWLGPSVPMLTLQDTARQLAPLLMSLYSQRASLPPQHPCLSPAPVLCASPLALSPSAIVLGDNWLVSRAFPILQHRRHECRTSVNAKQPPEPHLSLLGLRVFTECLATWLIKQFDARAGTYQLGLPSLELQRRNHNVSQNVLHILPEAQLGYHVKCLALYPRAAGSEVLCCLTGTRIFRNTHTLGIRGLPKFENYWTQQGN